MIMVGSSLIIDVVWFSCFYGPWATKFTIQSHNSREDAYMQIWNSMYGVHMMGVFLTIFISTLKVNIKLSVAPTSLLNI